MPFVKVVSYFKRLFFGVLKKLIFQDIYEQEDGKQGTNNQQQEANALTGTWKGEVQDNNITQLITYCFNADGTGWDNWNGEKEAFTWYTKGDILNIIYKDDSPYGDGYDEDKYYYTIANNRAYIYECDDDGKKGNLIGVFTKQ